MGHSYYIVIAHIMWPKSGSDTFMQTNSQLCIIGLRDYSEVASETYLV